MTNFDLNGILKNFQIEGEVAQVKLYGDGLINKTYFVETRAADAPNYILQTKNSSIFKDVPGMMDNILKVTNHLKAKVVAAGGDPLREAMTVIMSHDGEPFYKDEAGNYWTVYLFIEDTLIYEKADSPETAYAGGRGIGKFQRILSDMPGTLTDILPGFHNIRFRFKQWDEVIAKDPAGRKNSVQEEIQWIESRRDEMLCFWELVESGEIPTRVTHNDTKINNILFDKEGEVLCVIDLDTVLSSTALNDFGDAIRSYTNTGLEDDPNPENVSMDIQIFRAFTEGYLSEAKDFLTETEMKYLAFSARYITYEQVLRFLMDYIDGDNYYRTNYENHNLVRTHAQYRLLESIEQQKEAMDEIVMENCKLG
ncbi:phosphotransferase enzyme family protein [Mangrovibacterium marinum]|uniref:Phosphotransferase family enzyme n=1 Tax=Mangrovibacterium marinum TaxID=1639118 RepID=A0A2T5BXJ1_9BACT|nr:aminoglycoside phosphotransferase family protein [Mangrovibacterium marinum]PTN05281.1 phosphotransferase family enzyme [Mangrovibacterium marinum]